MLVRTDLYSGQPSRALLRKAILEIQNDPGLTYKQKAMNMQTLMTRDHVTLSHQQPSGIALEAGYPLSAMDQRKTYYDEDQEVLGCDHYRRNCKLQ